MVADTEAAWAAGLFEGEGTFGSQPSLSLTTTDLDVARRFADFVGKKDIYAYRKEREHHRQAYRVHLTGKPNVERAIRLMLPYLGQRRTARALEVLAVCLTPNRPKGRRCEAGCSCRRHTWGQNRRRVAA